MSLYPFQEEAVQKTLAFLRQRNCVYNASDMGTGKTLVTITAIDRMPEVKEVLVLCPKSVKMVWEAEVYQWRQSRSNKYTILSYDTAKKPHCYIPLMESQRWDMLVMDEAHACKDLDNDRTKAVMLKIWPQIKYKICLSGTPFTQSIMDCWPIFSAMCPEDFKDYWEFAKAYTKVVRVPFGKRYKFEGVKNHEKLKKIIKEKFFFRYIKEEHLKELPEKTYQLIPLPAQYLERRTEAEEVAHERYLELLKKSFATSTQPPTPPVALATTIRKQGLKKVPAVVEFARNLLDSNTPIVLFCYHTEVIDKIKEELKAYEPVIIQGKSTDADRKRSVDAFQAGDTNLFIGQIKASGVGITLTRSSTVLFAEYSFSPADIQQAIDRTHRIGQKNAVIVYYFSVAGSTDEKFQKILMQKSSDFKKILQ